MQNDGAKVKAHIKQVASPVQAIMKRRSSRSAPRQALGVGIRRHCVERSAETKRGASDISPDAVRPLGDK